MKEVREIVVGGGEAFFEMLLSSQTRINNYAELIDITGVAGVRQRKKQS